MPLSIATAPVREGQPRPYDGAEVRNGRKRQKDNHSYLPDFSQNSGGCPSFPRIKERRAITPDTALRLARYFGTDAQSWLNLQSSYDLRIATRDLGKRIAREVSPKAA